MIPITRFDQSISADSRDQNGVQLCKHFDNFTRPHALVPYKDSEKINNGGSPEAQNQTQLQNFLLNNGHMYLLGRQASTQKALIERIDDYSNPTISTPANGQDNTYTISNYDLFFDYQNVLWGSNSQGLWSYTIATTTFNETAVSSLGTVLGYTNALVHSKDSVAYFAYYNATAAYIARKNGTNAWEVSALTIPTVTHKPVSICEDGNYLVILMAPINPGLNSYFILWDRDSSLNTVSEVVDLGNRDAKFIENISGYLIIGSIIPTLNTSSNSQIIFSKYDGGNVQDFKRLSITGGTTLGTRKQKYNGRVYFTLSAATSIGGTTNDYTGVWSIGITNGDFSLVFDHTPKNDTPVQQILGFFIVQDYFYISYLVTNGGTDYELSKTNDQASYTTTSQYRTAINPRMDDNDKPKTKSLKYVSVTYDPLPGTSSARQVAVKYKRDGYDFSTVLTKTDDAVIETKVITEAYRDSNGDPFEAGRDYEFLIESKGVTVTGFYYDYN